MPPRTRIRSSKKTRWLSIIPLGLVLIAAGAFVYVSKTPDSPFNPKLTPISVAEALNRYRAHPDRMHSEVAIPTEMPAPPAQSITGFTVPKPGVYTYTTDGQDWIEYNGQKYLRHFPAETAATVRTAGGCGWELTFQAAEEYSDGHVQCSSPGEFLCLAHIQGITFGTITRLMEHQCHPAMIQVGDKASADGGVNTAVCHASEHDPSEITITFKETTQLTVDGQSRKAYHVLLDSKVDGEVKGTAIADVWFDAETGTYLKMVRKQDTYVDLSGGDRAYYRVRITYELKSLTPQT